MKHKYLEFEFKIIVIIVTIKIIEKNTEKEISEMSANMLRNVIEFYTHMHRCRFK